MILKLNVISPEVIPWQKFLGLPETGIFDERTKVATQKWQAAHGLDADGEVGPKTYAAAGVTTNRYYPPRPAFSSPTAEQRELMFGKFSYVKKNASDITIIGDWVQKNIIKVTIPQLIGVSGAPRDGGVYFNRKGAEQLKGFFNDIETQGLLPLVISWAGAFYPRFIRGSATRLSNHSWGTAFDINAPQNWLGQQPAAEGKPGSLLRLVPIANKWGFFWGGHYSSRLDGMHFELARLAPPSLLLDLATISAAADPSPLPDEATSSYTPEPAANPAATQPPSAPADSDIGSTAFGSVLGKYQQASGKFDQVNEIISGVQTRIDSIKALRTTVAGGVWQLVLAVIGFFMGLPKELLWVALAVLTTGLIYLYLHRQTALGKIREQQKVPADVKVDLQS